MQFYPKDWLADPALRACSIAARGAWIDMLCVMWTSPKRGELRMPNGCPMDARAMQRLCSADAQEMQIVIEELEGAGVFSRCSDGAIYCRRMHRDEAERIAKSDHGKRGAECRWGAQDMPEHGSPTPTPTPTSSPAPVKDSVPNGTGESGQKPDPPKPAKVRKLTPEQTEAIRDWTALFADCYLEVTRAYPTGYKPDDNRLPHPKVQQAALWFEKNVKRGDAKTRLVGALKGDYYVTPPASLAEFKVMYDRLIEANRKKQQGGSRQGVFEALKCSRNNPGCVTGSAKVCRFCPNLSPAQRENRGGPRELPQ